MERIKEKLSMPKGTKRSLAFTLAEVLIVIAIIGMIAEMTLPTLIQSYQKQVYVVQLKKFYSEFSQGLKLLMVDDSCDTLSCTGIFDNAYTDATWQSSVQTAMNKSFKIANNSCFSFVGPNSCRETSYFLGTARGVGGNTGGDQFTAASFVTLDGYAVQFVDNDAGNCLSTSPYTINSKSITYCSELYVDVNGPRNPNVFGRDIFAFIIGNDGFLYPVGGDSWRSAQSWCGVAGSSTLSATVNGVGCAARIIDEGWQMNY